MQKLGKGFEPSLDKRDLRKTRNDSYNKWYKYIAALRKRVRKAYLSFRDSLRNSAITILITNNKTEALVTNKP